MYLYWILGRSLYANQDQIQRCRTWMPVLLQWHTPCCNWPPSVVWDQTAWQSWSSSHATDASKRLRERDVEQVSEVDCFVMDGISSYFVDITIDMPSNHNVLNNMIWKPSHWLQRRIFSESESEHTADGLETGPIFTKWPDVSPDAEMPGNFRVVEKV